MPDLSLPITQILQGHTQSFYQALRLFDSFEQKHSPELMAIGSPEPISIGSPEPISTDSSEPISTDSPEPAGVNSRELARSVATSDRQTLSPQTLLALVKKNTDEPVDKYLLSGFLKLQTPTHLARQYLSSLYFVDVLLRQLLNQTQPHPAIKKNSLHFSRLLAALLLQRPDIAINREHPLTQLIGELFQQLAIWEPGAGRTGRALPHLLDQLGPTLADIDINTTTPLKALLHDFWRYREDELGRVHKLEQRLLNSENNAKDIEQAHNTVLRFVNRRLGGQLLPEDVMAFIQNQLIGDLQYLLIHQGVAHPNWKRWQRLLQILSWAFQQSDTINHKNKIDTLLPSLIEQLDLRYCEGFTDPAPYESFIGQLHGLFAAVIRQSPLDCEPFPQQKARGDASGPARILVEQGIIEDLTSHSEGHWYLFQSDSNEQLRGKLLMKNAKTDTLLFVNYAGRKLASYSFEDFSLALAAKVILVIPQTTLYEQALKMTLDQLQRRHQCQSSQQIKAAEKAQSEALQLAKQKASKQAKDQAKNQNGDIASSEQLINTLQVGAWVSMSDDDGTLKRIKLSVKLQAADKYIFTDRLGQRAGEYTRQSLIQLTDNQQLNILSQGDDFESNLEKVVRTLRRTTS